MDDKKIRPLSEVADENNEMLKQLINSSNLTTQNKTKQDGDSSNKYRLFIGKILPSSWTVYLMSDTTEVFKHKIGRGLGFVAAMLILTIFSTVLTSCLYSSWNYSYFFLFIAVILSCVLFYKITNRKRAYFIYDFLNDPFFKYTVNGPNDLKTERKKSDLMKWTRITYILVYISDMFHLGLMSQEEPSYYIWIIPCICLAVFLFIFKYFNAYLLASFTDYDIEEIKYNYKDNGEKTLHIIIDYLDNNHFYTIEKYEKTYPWYGEIKEEVSDARGRADKYLKY